jgi:tetratricopeptide (TPR) repeat protein
MRDIKRQMKNTEKRFIKCNINIINVHHYGFPLSACGNDRFFRLRHSLFTAITVILPLFFATNAAFAAQIAENFLSHGPSVSAYGRGETGNAVFEDNSSVYYNPSLLAEANGNGAVLAEHTLTDGAAYSYAGVNAMLNGGAKGAVGVSVINLKSGDDLSAADINSSLSTFNTNQWAYYLTYAQHLEKYFGLNYGISLKYVAYDMLQYKGGGLGADIGLSKEFAGPVVFGNTSAMSVGVSVLNVIAPSVTLISEADTLGAIYRFGGVFFLPVFYGTVSHDIISLFVDANLQENMLIPSFGAEYTFAQKYVLRAGYFADNPTVGAGFKVKDFKVDYAIDFGDLSVMNRFLVEYRWGDVKSSNEATVICKQAHNSVLMEEAQKALRNNEINSDKLEKEVDPKFKGALKDYNNSCYLLAADKFRDIMLKYPQYGNAGHYYQLITDKMNEDSKLSLDSDFEKLSYAKGYVDYRGQKYNDAVNEWEKVLQMNPNRDELTQYDSIVKGYLKDIERIKKEKEIEGRVSALFDDGKADFDAKKWIACIKTMEKVQNICKAEPFTSSFEWNSKAQDYIGNSISELSKIAYAKPAKKTSTQEDKQPEPEIDAQGADKKYNEGLVLYAQGKTEDAIRVWEIAIRLNPNHEKTGIAIEKARIEIELRKKK